MLKRACLISKHLPFIATAGIETIDSPSSSPSSSSRRRCAGPPPPPPRLLRHVALRRALRARSSHLPRDPRLPAGREPQREGRPLVSKGGPRVDLRRLPLHCLFSSDTFRELIAESRGILDRMMASPNLFVRPVVKPLFSFGVISDIQYANIPDGHSFLGTPRYYRHSMQVLQRAVQKWNNHGKIQFSIHFGDIIDGFCPKEESLSAVQNVLDEFGKFSGPVYHMIGNHCLYNLPRSKLNVLLNIPSRNESAYYDFSPVPGYRFVVLDAYDISAIGWPEDHPNTAEALRILQQKNPNVNKNSSDGLVGPEKRFRMFNGAVGKEQLEWLDGILQDATKHNQKTIICCHLPLNREATIDGCLLWNYDEVMNVIHKYNCVKACIAGHDHSGGYSIDSHGIHHRTLEAALECPPGSNAFGHIDVYNDRLTLLGIDRMMSTEMVFSS